MKAGDSRGAARRSTARDGLCGVGGSTSDCRVSGVLSVGNANGQRHRKQRNRNGLHDAVVVGFFEVEKRFWIRESLLSNIYKTNRLRFNKIWNAQCCTKVRMMVRRPLGFDSNNPKQL